MLSIFVIRRIYFLVAVWFKLFRRIWVIFDHHDLSPEMYEAKYQRRDIFIMDYAGLNV